MFQHATWDRAVGWATFFAVIMVDAGRVDDLQLGKWWQSRSRANLWINLGLCTVDLTNHPFLLQEGRRHAEVLEWLKYR